MLSGRDRKQLAVAALESFVHFVKVVRGEAKAKLETLIRVRHYLEELAPQSSFGISIDITAAMEMQDGPGAVPRGWLA